MPVFKWRMQTTNAERQNGGMERRRGREARDASSGEKSKVKERKANVNGKKDNER